MHIDLLNFEKKINNSVLKRGKIYYRNEAVTHLQQTQDGVYCAKVIGTKMYHVKISLSPEHTIQSASCDCPYYYDSESYCKHIVATLYALRNELSEGTPQCVSSESSSGISELITNYHKQYETEIELAYMNRKIHLVPALHCNSSGELFTELKIGSDRMYIVKDVTKLQSDFEQHRVVQYGKFLEFRHHESLLSEQERELLQFLVLLSHQGSSGYYYNRATRVIKLPPAVLKNFFALTGNSVEIDGTQVSIYHGTPDLQLTISERSNAKKKKYALKATPEVIFLGNARQLCFYQPQLARIDIAPPDFSAATGKLLEMLLRERNQELMISEADMPAFYTTVLQPVSQYLSILGLDQLQDLAPPEIQTQLYLDLPEKDTICAKLEFVYDTLHFAAFEKKENRTCNLPKEIRAEHSVLQFFTHHPEDPHHPLLLSGEDAIYHFMTEGIPLLEREMELYASEQFQKIRIRPPVRPVIGIRPDNDLLQLEIHAEDYDQQELLDLLSAYRNGKSYHRLRDGSFVGLTEAGMGALSKLTESLNLSNKEILQQQLKIPKYRMLYLDSLQSQPEGIRIQRSRAFSEAVSRYHAMTEQESETLLPESLQSVLRPYQKQGFYWMSAICAYGFGGVLADDMGLGKTLQAIALMCSEKQSTPKGEHRLHLVVCPASLTLNWKNEIERFAPELKAGVIIGSAPNRKHLLMQAKQYDVLITSYTTLARDAMCYQDLSIDLQILDEAQYIKNHTTQAAKAARSISSRARFALTGTPVENSLSELWSIFDFIMPKYLFPYGKFKSTYETPIVRQQDSDAIKALQKMISPFILRRMKKEVLTELPEKTETVLLNEMNELQNQLYAATVLKTKQLLENSDNTGDEKLRILSMLTRLRQICCDPSLIFENYEGESAKLEQCLELVESCVTAGHKLLLFSQFTTMLDRIAERLQQKKIPYYLLTGSTKTSTRIELVHAFNQNDTPVFLISLKAGGTGLNLTGADIVIHYDPWWNLSAEQQATDRVYRIGQKNNVQVYKLITKGTIEENIQKMQKKKAELAKIAVSGEENLLKMSSEDILELLN